MVEFIKMSGIGNDFIVVDNRNKILEEKELSAFAIKYCSRRYSLGADGVLLLENALKGYKMRLINKDGSEGEMCGNGARCFVKYLNYLGLIENEVIFQTLSGEIHGYMEENSVGIKLKDINKKDIDLSLELEVYNKKLVYSYLVMGVPHSVIVNPEINLRDEEYLTKLGREIRKKVEIFPDGTNVNFVKIIDGKEAKKCKSKCNKDKTTYQKKIKLGRKKYEMEVKKQKAFSYYDCNGNDIKSSIRTCNS